MTQETEDSRLGNSLFEKIVGDSSWMDTMISGKEEHRAAILNVAIRSIVHLPEVQQAFLKKMIEVLSQEGEHDETDRRDAALGMMNTSTIVDLLPNHQEALFSSYLEGLGRQTKNNDPYSGSIRSLLEAGILLSPFFPQDELSRTQLAGLLEHVAQPFLPGVRRDIALFTDDILESMTMLGARDARVKYWKLRKLKDKEIASRLDTSLALINQSVERLVEDGELTSKREASQERDGHVLALMEQGLTMKEMMATLDVPESQITGSRKRLYEQEKIDPDTYGEKVRQRKAQTKRNYKPERKTAITVQPSVKVSIESVAGEKEDERVILPDAEQEVVPQDVQGDVPIERKESEEVHQIRATESIRDVRNEKKADSKKKHVAQRREQRQQIFRAEIKALKLIGLRNDEIADLNGMHLWQVTHEVR
ncbi:MAG: hypothetical protein AAB855_00870, partial [Patescibacteria group bacterium]